MATREPTPRELISGAELERKLADLSEIDYSARKCPVWSREGTSSGEMTGPMQLAIDNKTQNIFVTDFNGDRIQVFDGEGNHLYQIPTPEQPTGIALSDNYIFVSTGSYLVKIERSSNQPIKSVETDNIIWGIDTNSNTDIYGCEINKRTIAVFDKNLKSQKRIKLKTTQVKSRTDIRSIKLHEDKMYVMFGHSPPFHLQTFNLKGQLVMCLIKENEIVSSDFFSIDRLGNIIVADWKESQIRIFSKEGEVLHTITSAMLQKDQEFYYPTGIAIDKLGRIIVAQRSTKCNLLAF